MPQKIPFFQLFPDLAPPPELKLPLLGSQICSAVIRQKGSISPYTVICLNNRICS